MQTAPGSSGFVDLPTPVLFNPIKHHAGELRHRISIAIVNGALAELARQLVVVGSELMDLYHGPLSPAGVAAAVIDELSIQNRLAPTTFAAWIAEAGGYRVVPLPDTSRWALRSAVGETRYVHIHPGRYSPHTLRVRANVLKTAVMALAYAGVHGGDPLDRGVINRARADHLQLGPVPDLRAAQAVTRIIDLLKFGK